MGTFITLGSMTNSGGKVIQVTSEMLIIGKRVALVGDIATCLCGKQNCRGQGPIVATIPRYFFIDDTPVAMEGDRVDTGCGTCILLADTHGHTVGGWSGGSFHYGQNGRGFSIGNQGTFSAQGAPSTFEIPSAQPRRSNPALEKFIEDVNATQAQIDAKDIVAEISAKSVVTSDETKRELESEVYKATVELLKFLPKLDLKKSIHTQAVKEFSEAFEMILKGYHKGNITYEIGYDLIHQIENGFIEGGKSLQKIEANRKKKNRERIGLVPNGGSYQRNMAVNNESFNVRFKASCATPECLMRNANIDTEDDAFQDYIEAATKDKRSDVMQVINTALILNPYLKALEGVANLDSAYSIANGDFDPVWSTAMGKGVVYRLRLLNLSERSLRSIENATAYITGDILSERKED